MISDDFLLHLRSAQQIASSIQAQLASAGSDRDCDHRQTLASRADSPAISEPAEWGNESSRRIPNIVLGQYAIRSALATLSPSLAMSYEQVQSDLSDPYRSSWAGTAHEIREVLINLLRTLAPDEVVESQAWYSQEKGSVGPTQKQRARYIMLQNGAGSREQEVVQNAVSSEDRIATLVRATYSRSSDAAHRTKDRVEVERIARYFDALAHDLLDIK